MSLAKYQASLQELEEEEEEEGEKELFLNESLEEVEEGLDEGEMLVIRRALSVIASQEDLEQRENIFRTRCIVNGKVCSVIDGEVVLMWPSRLWWRSASLWFHLILVCILEWVNQGKGMHISSL